MIVTGGVYLLDKAEFSELDAAKYYPNLIKYSSFLRFNRPNMKI